MQNIYDNETFFKGYDGMRKEKERFIRFIS